MTDDDRREIDQLVGEVQRAYAGDRQFVADRIRRATSDDAPFYEEIRAALAAATSRSAVSQPLFDPDSRAFDPMNDPSVQHTVVLQPDVAVDGPLDETFITSVGGRVTVCQVWTSVIAPWYAVDVHSESYDEKTDVWEFTELREDDVSVALAMAAVDAAMTRRGWRRLRPQDYDVRVPDVVLWPEIPEDASLFEALFADPSLPVKGWCRYRGASLTDVVPGAEFWWRETADSARTDTSHELCVWVGRKAVAKIRWSGDEIDDVTVWGRGVEHEADVEWRRDGAGSGARPPSA